MIKKTILLVLMLTVTASAFALEAEINGLWYELVSKVKEAKVIQYKNDIKYCGNIEIPETVEYEGITYSVTSIESNSFYYCSGLTSVTIPNSVTNIKGAFFLCTGLTSVHISDLEAWCKIAFLEQDSNPLFYAHHLFINGEEIKELIIPNSITSIGDYAFYGCSGITSVTIPQSVTSIGDVAFFGCSGITSVTIPQSVTSIGGQAFSGCDGLTSVHITDLEAWCKINFGDNPLSYAHHLFINGLEIMDLVIPEGVTNISGNAFSQCNNFATITIPNSVTIIGDRAFYGCSRLSSVTIPNNVTNIGFCAFNGCSGLKSIAIGSSVKKIYELAFANCPDITEVYCYAENVPKMYYAYTNRPCTNAFEGSYIEYATLIVPDESIENYKSIEPWSTFGSIKGLSGDIDENEKCATPTIHYANGKITYECETEDVSFHPTITPPHVESYNHNEAILGFTYTVEVYASKPGFQDSDVATATINLLEDFSSSTNDLNGDGKINVSDIMLLVNYILNH